MWGTASSIQIQDWGVSQRKAAVVATVSDPTKNALVVSKADGSDLTAFLNGLSIPAYDYISLSYTWSNLTGVVFKIGGSGGTTVATLTLAYDGSNNLTSVTKS